jgi:hypothetical protein
MLKYTAVLLISIISLAQAIEKPSYEVVRKIDNSAEIRKYASSKWASTSVRDQCMKMSDYSSRMFRSLFNYISGKNSQNQKIDMTAPVLTSLKNMNAGLIDRSSSCNMTMGFYVPKANQANTPQPSDSEVFLRDEPEITVAVIQFGWYPDMNDYISNRDSLIRKLGSEASSYDTVNMMVAGKFVCCFFFT